MIRQQKSVDEFASESNRFQLNVTYKPKIEIIVLSEDNREFKVNNYSDGEDEKQVYLYKNVENIGFKCKYNSNPKANSIIWFKNGVNIENNNKCKL